MALPLPYGSASSLSRLLACPASGVLPQIDTGTSAPAERGTALHAYLRNVEKVGRDKALAQVPEDLRPFAAGIDLTSLPVGLSAEVTYVYDLVSGEARILGQDLNRDYSGLRPHEIPATLDVCGVYDIGSAYLGDWKFGRSDIPHPSVNAQLRLGALAMARVHKVSLVRIELIRFYDDPANPSRIVDEMDAQQLDWFAEKLGTFRKETDILRTHYISTGRVQYVKEGDQCKWCPAFLQCPAKTALLSDALAGKLPEAKDSAERYRRSRDLDKLAKAYWGQMAGLARREPMDIGGGKVYGEFPSTEKVWDPNIVWDVVTEIHGPQVADVAAPRSTSEADIRRALREVMDPEHVEAAVKDTLTMIRNCGGLREVETKRLREGRLK